jgi:phasin
MAPSDRFEVPSEIRAFAERSVEQARQAFDGFMSAAQHAVTTFEGQSETARRGAKDVTQMAMTFAEQNIANSFELAQQLVRAKDMQEMMKLQADFIKNQMQALTDQAKELGQHVSEAAKDTAKPKR